MASSNGSLAITIKATNNEQFQSQIVTLQTTKKYDFNIIAYVLKIYCSTSFHDPKVSVAGVTSTTYIHVSCN
jgi:hypothetical protein